MHSYVLYNKLLGGKAVGRKDREKPRDMGGLQDRPLSTHSSTSTSTSYPDFTDAGPPLPPAVTRVLRNVAPFEPHQDHFRTLDRSMKAFLRSANLSGLEYRLKMAGFHTLDDLIEATTETLCSRGFTPLMARRLMNALDGYIQRHLDRVESVRNPFHIVRRNQKIKSDPSDAMKALPTYGKRNVKRRHPSKDSKPVKQVKQGNKPRPTLVRLISEESLPSEPIFPHVVETRTSVPSHDPPDPGAVGDDPHGGDDRGDHERGDVDTDTQRHSVIPFFEEYTLNDIDGPSSTLLSQPHIFTPSQPHILTRCMSVPADYRYYQDSSTTPPYSYYPYIRVRAYSCPPSLSSMTTPLELLLDMLSSTHDIITVQSLLSTLVKQVKVGRSSTAADIVRQGGVEVVVEVLQGMSAYPHITEQCCRILKHLTRLSGDILPMDAITTVLVAMDNHPTSEKVQIQGSLAVGNVGRSDPTQCTEDVFTGALHTLSTAMQSFPSSVKLQVSVMAALGVLLASVSSGRLLLITEHGHILDHVLQAMENFMNDSQVQQYSCAFLSLLTAEGPQIESGVVQLVVEHVCVAMETYSRDPHVTVWGAKVLANAAKNASFSQVKLALRCSELLVEALSALPEESGVQRWCCYGLLQLASGEKRVLEMLKERNVLSLCQKCSPSLTEQAKFYLDQLGLILTTTDQVER